MLSKELWLILGGSGQLGQALQNQLIKNNIEYVAPSSKDVDINNFAEASNYIFRLKPGVIINCAGWTDVVKAENSKLEANNLNGYAVENLLKACSLFSCILVHISTDYVFSGSKSLSYSASDKVDPINAYGLSKALGERFIVESGMKNYYIFRTAWLYSEYGDNFVKTIIKKNTSGERRIEVINDLYGNPTYAVDLACQIFNLINSNIPFGIYHTVNEGVTTWFNLAKKTLELLGQKTNNIVGINSSDISSYINRPKNSAINTTKWQDLGLPEMRSWELALKSAIPQIMKNL